MRQRLLADVGPYFDIVRTHHVGFWALIRMILPVVEAASVVIFPKKGRERPPVRLLRELGFSHPNLVWEMYRHTLSHNDEMVAAEYRGRKVRWCISIDEQHLEAAGRLQVDAGKLFEDLLRVLARRAEEAGTAQVWVKESFRFNNAFAQATRAEALALGKK